MRKLILLLVSCLWAISLQAQEHLKFKGVPIDGTLQEFVQKMKAKGFTSVGMQCGIAVLKGDFAGAKECTIGVGTLQGNNLVSKISVAFPEASNWLELYGRYCDLKEMLTEKYGSPSNCIEEFQRSYQPQDDADRFYEAKSDRCKFITTFSPSTGDIELRIAHGDYKCFVILSYFDGYNSYIVRKKAMDDL